MTKGVPVGLTNLAMLCLALNVYYEARGEPFEGQVAVAEVTLNRVALSKMSVCDVVYEEDDQHRVQFSWTRGDQHVAPLSQEQLETAYIAAQLAVEGDYIGSNGGTPLTGGATHFHADYVHPYWADNLVKTVQIGRHIFYRDEEWYTGGTRTARVEIIE